MLINQMSSLICTLTARPRLIAPRVPGTSLLPALPLGFSGSCVLLGAGLWAGGRALMYLQPLPSLQGQHLWLGHQPHGGAQLLL